MAISAPKGPHAFHDEHAKKLIAAAAKLQSGLYFQSAAPAPTARGRRRARRRRGSAGGVGFGKTTTQADQRLPTTRRKDPGGAGAHAGTIVSIAVKEGDAVAAGQPLLIMDAMKMQHEIRSPARATCGGSRSSRRDIYEGHALLFVEEADVEVKDAAIEEKIDSTTSGADLGEYSNGRALTARRQEARCPGPPAQDQPADSAAESRRPGRSRQLRRMGRFAIASQRTRDHRGSDREDAGRRAHNRHGRVNGSLFGRAQSRRRRALRLHSAGGTQGKTNHHKKEAVRDRRGAAHPVGLLHRGRRWPAGDVDVQSVAGSIHGLSISSGASAACRPWSASTRAAASPATQPCSLLRRGDRTKNSSIGMGGPAMIEGAISACSRPRKWGR